MLQSTHLNASVFSLATTNSRSDLLCLHLSLWSPSERLSARRDNELDINLTISVKFILYEIVFPFSFYFLIDTDNVWNFLVFSRRHVKSDLPISSASFLIMKW